MPVRRVPLHASDARLLGGLDLCATLAAGRPVSERGLLHEADGGLLLLAMAERLTTSAAARFMAVMDTAQVILERDGLSSIYRSEIGVIAFDESDEGEAGLVEGLKDRLAFTVDLRTLAIRDLSALPWSGDDIAAATRRYPQVTMDDELIAGVCSAAVALGIDSLRAPLLTCRVAKALSALQGQLQVSEADAACAARLVLSPRARTRPPEEDNNEPLTGQPADQAEDSERHTPPAADEPPSPPQPPALAADEADAAANDHAADRQEQAASSGAEEDGGRGEGPQDTILAAVRSALPEGLLSQMKSSSPSPAARGGASNGRGGSGSENLRRGRPVGSRRGELANHARLHLLETLRAAAPWQALRRRQLLVSAPVAEAPRIQVRREDFYIRRFVQRPQTTTIFLVDASGSAALHRLAEAKGAVEQLLAECYIRRDRVAVLGFRQHSAELLLPPTRSLVRAKRSLAAMPASGGTPLATAIDAGAALADTVRRQGDTPFIVLLSDGRANVSRDGRHDRNLARQDALSAAGALRAAQLTSLFVDTSPRSNADAHHMAQSMGAKYVALPYVDSGALCSAIRTAMQ
jgi:magnesium chelatase subunit D